MTETSSDPQDDQATYTAYEIDFMLNLRATEAAAITREQIGIRSAPEEASDFVTAAVTAGLFARGKVEHSEDGQWLLGNEGQIIAGTLTGADRWLGMALAQGGAMRMAFIVKAGEAILMLTQDELDTFQITALPDPGVVAQAATDITAAFLSQSPGNTVSLRRADVSDPAETTSVMFHVEEDGGWKVGHEPLTAEGVLTVSDIEATQVHPVIAALWDEGISAAPSV